MNTERLKIINGKIITPFRILQGGTVLVANGKIEALSQGDIEAGDAQVIDAKGNYVAPGFIDIHVHGGGGHDFMDNSLTAFLEIAKLHARHGTTALTPTTLTAEKRDLIQTLELYDQAHRENTQGAQFIGMHLEGPYFALNQRGAQDPRYIRDPDPEEYKALVPHFPSIKRWSAAPELKGALDFGHYMRTHGVLPAIAHTDALYDDVLEAFEKGYTHVTHLYSCMNGVVRRNAFRYAGVVESAYLMDEMTVEIIADGIHVPAPLLKLVYKIKGPDKVALITDAMRAAGMPPGESILGSLTGGLKVIVEDDVAKLPDRSSFAGSVATADRLVRNMVTLADVPLTDAVRMMTSTPAAIMGIEKTKGKLEQGMDADIIIFDASISVDTTIVGGRIIFRKEA
ncbi:N-acetylglucosamine-6-phosphate deacetylase [Chryseolinea lacunae]|uniref:N-acetylglucosamine-6-phosphate deacetylase n=1 Tax=Chryseolinea lacunae TaxID=2801331 RepID=A0ABS1KU44_9BACT|nr:N-acetylglucosamine-6-phosphate deacetylase [Chryseolinea lacunae]MBL0742981.1 N-acetylglucosamine-6-phosphate deacetylase [Chryseolinea lacunae]